MNGVNTTSKNIVPLENIPQSIREWLGSDVLKFSITNLNNRLNLKNWKITIIPELILEITTKEILPEELIPKLAKQLDLSHSTASLVAKTIYEQLLKTIQRPLKNELGVDLDQIFAAIAEPTLSLQKEELKIIAPSPEETTEKAEPQTIQEQQKISPPTPEISETRKIDIAKIETLSFKQTETQPLKSAQTTNGPEPHIIYKEIKTFKVPITISEQKNATADNVQESKSYLSPRNTGSGINVSSSAAPTQVGGQASSSDKMGFSGNVVPLPQTEKFNLQQLLENRKNNAEGVQRQTPLGGTRPPAPTLPTPPSGARPPTLSIPPRQTNHLKTIPDVLSNSLKPKSYPPSDVKESYFKPKFYPSTGSGNKISVLSENLGVDKQESRRIPIKPEPKTATMLPKNFQQKNDFQSKPQVKLTNTRVVHYSDLRTPLNSV